MAFWTPRPAGPCPAAAPGGAPSTARRRPAGPRAAPGPPPAPPPRRARGPRRLGRRGARPRVARLGAVAEEGGRQRRAQARAAVRGEHEVGVGVGVVEGVLGAHAGRPDQGRDGGVGGRGRRGGGRRCGVAIGALAAVP